MVSISNTEVTGATIEDSVINVSGGRCDFRNSIVPAKQILIQTWFTLSSSAAVKNSSITGHIERFDGTL